MQTIFESDNFLVSRHCADAAKRVPECFEIVDKRIGMEVCLAHALAVAFRNQIGIWQSCCTSTEEIETYLDGYSVLAHLPVRAH